MTSEGEVARATSAAPPLGSPLSVLGFTPALEALYRLLLRNSGLSLNMLSTLLDDRARSTLYDDLHALTALGLVDVQGLAVEALPPDRALTRLIDDESQRLRSRDAQLASLRGWLPALSAEHVHEPRPRGEPVAVERVEGGDVGQLIRTLSARATGDLLWLRPDTWRLPEGREVDPWIGELIRSGRRSRAIYPVEALEVAPGAVARRARLGEQIRVLPQLPGRIAILGEGAALLPEDLAAPGPRRLVVRHRGLVSVLTLLFESLWAQALPVPALEERRGEPGPRTDRALLLEQLTGGAKDEQIARALGLSLRTVRRRVADLLVELGASSRFQAGVEAARRGLL